MAKISYSNELIRKRRKKKAVKKLVVFFVLLFSILIILCFKLPYFNIVQITVFNNKSISQDEIIKLSKLKLGTNLFYQNFAKSKKEIMSNPYILDVTFSRKIPNEVEIFISERKAEFYSTEGSEFAIFDKNSIGLEIKDNINNMKLVRVDGIDIKSVKLGKALGNDDDKRVKTIKTISDLNSRKMDGVPDMTSIDLTNANDLKIYYGDIYVILGAGHGIEEKLNKAISILQSDGVKSGKGYIDVSFNGIPVVSLQK
ncbi:MAG: FtsQ-type POTRA domain-containing protein [Clostridiaceae bacterium]|nr:FtsQ-type POTRA domain-containing protein [Clostridiaceae bacterium]